jgi:multiple sugar transport system permease protein
MSAVTDTASRRGPAGQRSWPRRLAAGPTLWLLPSVIVLVLISIYPQIYSLVNSFRFYNLSVQSSPLGWVGGDNYLAAFNDADFLSALARTAVFAVITTAVEIVLGLAVATLLMQPLTGVRLARTLLIMPTAIAPAIAGLAFRSMYDPSDGLVPYVLDKIGVGSPDAGILGSTSTALAGVIITDVWEWTPFAALILLAAMQGVSGELLEAGRIDGANAVQLFRSIVLPLITPVLVTVTLLRFISTFNVFDIIFVETRGGPGVSTTVAGLDVYYNGLTYYNIGYASALTWIITIIVAILINVYLATAGRKAR